MQGNFYFQRVAWLLHTKKHLVCSIVIRPLNCQLSQCIWFDERKNILLSCCSAMWLRTELQFADAAVTCPCATLLAIALSLMRLAFPALSLSQTWHFLLIWTWPAQAARYTPLTNMFFKIKITMDVCSGCARCVARTLWSWAWRVISHIVRWRKNQKKARKILVYLPGLKLFCTPYYLLGWSHSKWHSHRLLLQLRSTLSEGWVNYAPLFFMERNPFSAKNQTLRSYRVYISPTK